MLEITYLDGIKNW